MKAVDRAHLKIVVGEVLGLVGRSRCGKVPWLFQLWFEGENLLSKSEGEMRKIRGGKISMIFHNPMSSMNPAFTVGSQIAEAIRPHQNTLKH